MALVDAEKFKLSVDIVDVIGRYVPLKKKGSFFAGLCPFHNDHKNSLEVVPSKRIWKCHACDAGGDVIDFVRKFTGSEFREACEIIDGNLPMIADYTQATPKAKTKPDWTPVFPIVEPKSFRHYTHGEPSMVFKWIGADGATLCYTLRYDIGDGEKEVLPYTYQTNGERTEWRFMSLPSPHPLYNAHLLASMPDATVIVVEGEKTADALQAVMPSAVVTTWIGGSNGTVRADWAMLSGRKVLIWPDNDWQGTRAAIEIQHKAAALTKSMRMIRNPRGVERGWDFADSGWDTEATRAWINDNRVDIPAAEVSPPPQWLEGAERWWLLTHPDTGEAARYLYEKSGRLIGQELPEPEELPELPPMEDEPPMQFERSDDEYRPFEFLGFDKSDSGEFAYYFYVSAAKKVARYTTGKLSKHGLLGIAPLNYWENNFPKKGGYAVEQAVDWLTQHSQRRGIFSGKNIRGRGAWMEKGLPVLHIGDRLIVGGIEEPLGKPRGRYIYEQAEPIDFHTGDRLANRETALLIDMLELVNWERPISSYLLAGWCVIAPICGVLPWRPHIGITGTAGTGKSWIMHQIVRRLLGEMCLVAQGETSEAGLRQTLGVDAMPVLFDEAEGEDRRGSDRMQQILALARSASTEDGGKIIKGTSGHEAKAFVIRSCFAFASIVPQVSGQADRSRVTILAIMKEHDQKVAAYKWQELQRMHSEIMNERFIKGLQARTISLIPTILKNAATFSNAVAAELGEQRTGDQLGALLAGAYSLKSSEVISFDDAVKWVKSKDWSEERALDATRDEISLVRYIIEQVVEVETMSARYKRSVAELVEICMGYGGDEAISVSYAESVLKRCGLRVDEKNLVVSNTAEWVKTRLRDTSWSKNHNKVLMRIKGAKPLEPTRFAAGMQHRAVSIPYAAIIGIS